MELYVTTEKYSEVIDITDKLQAMVNSTSKVINVCASHTTCAITTADLDPGTDQDLLDAIHEIIPKLRYRHPHNPEHAPSHLASSIIGTSVTIPVMNGKLILGTWQRVVLVEFDGPKKRTLIVTNL